MTFKQNQSARNISIRLANVKTTSQQLRGRLQKMLPGVYGELIGIKERLVWPSSKTSGGETAAHTDVQYLIRWNVLAELEEYGQTDFPAQDLFGVFFYLSLATIGRLGAWGGARSAAVFNYPVSVLRRSCSIWAKIFQHSFGGWRFSGHSKTAELFPWRWNLIRCCLLIFWLL